MKKTILSFFSVALLFPTLPTHAAQPDTGPTVTISGRVTDFDGVPIDSSIVRILDSSFKDIYVTYTDLDGNYSLEVNRGRYMAMYAMRPEEYPRQNAVRREDMRLEFWAWNIIADSDLTINPRYHKLELYGTNVFEVPGGYHGLFVYFRPMSVTKLTAYSEEVLTDKKLAEQNADISIKPEFLTVRIFADQEELKINSVQPVEEFIGSDNHPLRGYIVQTDYPRPCDGKPYRIIRIEAENREDGEKGENIYFYETPRFR